MKDRKIRRVSNKNKDVWELIGKRSAAVRVVNLETGETGTTKIIVDADNQVYCVKCLRCGEWGKYPFSSITDNQKNSGLCPDCFDKENNNSGAFFGQSSDGTWECIPISRKRNSIIASESEIKKIDKLLYPKIKFKIIKSPSDPFKKAKELIFVDQDSDYVKAIENFKIKKYQDKFSSFEKWKRDHQNELIELLSWSDDEVSQKKFRSMFPNVRSAAGKKVSTLFLRAMKEHCSNTPTKVVKDWQGFEFSIRDQINRWSQLDPRRYLIFKVNDNVFYYKEIDVLAIGSNSKMVIDAKWCGGEIDKLQMEEYMKFLQKIGIEVTKGVFVTADDKFEILGNNIFVIPLEWFKLMDSIDNVDKFIDRVTKKKKKVGKN